MSFRFLFRIIFFSGLLSFVTRVFPNKIFMGSGSHEKLIFHETLGWQEVDIIGSGFHLLTDNLRPNIYLYVFKTDGAESQMVGVPNNYLSGPQTELTNGVKRSAGDFYELIDRAKRTVDCGYGNWTNNFLDYFTDDASSVADLLGIPDQWKSGPLTYDKPDDTDASAIDAVRDSSGKSFLRLRDEMHGREKTRYLFTVFVEDNTNHWLKCTSGGDLYDIDCPDDDVSKYYPLKKVVTRITEAKYFFDFPDPDNPYDNVFTKDKFVGGVWEEDPEDDDFEYDEYYDVRKEPTSSTDPDPFEMEFVTAQAHHVPKDAQFRFGGRLIYSYSFHHSFRNPTGYIIQIKAVDMTGNARILRVPILMESLTGIEIHNKQVDNIRQSY